MLDQLRPVIVTCTESWHKTDIYNAEVIPEIFEYTMFRRVRGFRGGAEWGGGGGGVSSLSGTITLQTEYKNKRKTKKKKKKKCEILPMH